MLHRKTSYRHLLDLVDFVTILLNHHECLIFLSASLTPNLKAWTTNWPRLFNAWLIFGFFGPSLRKYVICIQFQLVIMCFVQTIPPVMCRWSECDHEHGVPSTVNPYNADLVLYKPWRPKGFYQFEIVKNALVNYFRFIWIPMLWVYVHYKYFHSYSAGIDFRRQNLTSQDVRFWYLKSIPAL